MRNLIPLAVLCVCVSICGVSATAADRDTPEHVTVITGPTVIGFASAALVALADTAAYASSAIAHMQFALADVAGCLVSLDPVIEQKFADVLVWESAGERSQLNLSGELSEQLGVLLVSPGVAPQVIDASMGPSSLPYLVSNAAADYFQVPGCQVGP